MEPPAWAVPAAAAVSLSVGLLFGALPARRAAAAGPGGGAGPAMSLRDLVRLAVGAVLAHRLRSALTMLGILIGIASVILLTSIGEGTRADILARVHAVRHPHPGRAPGEDPDRRPPGPF